MALKKIILNAEEINLPTKLSDLENDLGLGGGDIDNSNFATKETVMTTEIAVYADGFRTSNGDWFAFPGTESENNADFCIAIVDDIPTKTSELTNDSGFITADDIPKEVELINITSNMLADEPTYTVAEAQAIIEAYNANKLIALKSTMTTVYSGKGWFIPNIYIRSAATNTQVYISGVLANFYIEHRFIYNTSTNSITAVYVDKKVDLSAVTTTYVDEAIANAITNTLNTPV